MWSSKKILHIESMLYTNFKILNHIITMPSYNISILWTVIIYFLFLTFLGIRGYKKTKTFSDYIIGNRKLGPIVGAMNVGASDMSSWLLMALPGAFYLFGMNNIWIIIGLIAGSFASWKLIAPRLRIFTEEMGNAITISSFLENRFEDNTKILRIVTTVMIVFFFFIYIASGFVGSAKLFSAILDTSFHTALLLSIFLIVFYALIGGFLAVSWADLFQGSLMLFTLIIVPIVIAFSMGGIGNVLHEIKINSPAHLNPFYNMNAESIIALLGWGLGYFGQPHIISKYLSIKNISDIKIARRICLSWMTISMIFAGFTGLFGYIYFLSQPLENHEIVFIAASHHLLPAFIVGLVIAAILGAIMSTINGQIIISCGNLTEDIYKRFFRKNASQKELLVTSRLLVVLLVFATYFIVKDGNNTVLNLVSYAWSGLGAAIGPVIICALFFKKATKLGAICGVIIGGASSVLFSNWKIFSYELFPSFALSLCVIIIISLIQNKTPSSKILAVFKKCEKLENV